MEATFTLKPKIFFLRICDLFVVVVQQCQSDLFNSDYCHFPMWSKIRYKLHFLRPTVSLNCPFLILTTFTVRHSKSTSVPIQQESLADRRGLKQKHTHPLTSNSTTKVQGDVAESVGGMKSVLQ